MTTDNEAVSASAILTPRQTQFNTPTRNGRPTCVQVRLPMEFNLPAPIAAIEPQAVVPGTRRAGFKFACNLRRIMVTQP